MRTSSYGSPMILRSYQTKLVCDIYQAWSQGAVNVLGVLPTGGGKTVVFSDIINAHRGASCAIAHRQELVSQISLALARNKAQHRIIGSEKLIKHIVRLHIDETGHNYYNPSSNHAVAGVDTLIRRKENLRFWSETVTLWVLDETHHLTKANKWGKAVAMFPNAKGLGVTAIPERADGKGLGRHSDGLMDTLVEGPGMRELINQGYLSDYRIFMPPTDLDVSQVTISKATGDFNPYQLKRQVRKSRIMGDVIEHYLKHANGKLGITFATDVESATDIAHNFNKEGVPAAVVTAKTPDVERFSIFKKFLNRKLLNLVNVDLFGEGVDLPALEVVSMARPSESFNLVNQQFGRTLRVMEGKQNAIIIDHVGNILRHGLPDAPRKWTLDRRKRRSNGVKDPDLIPVRTCTNPKCGAVYEAIYKTCPYCGYVPKILNRSGPEFVDGDLTELSPEVLAIMRGEIDRIDAPPSEIRDKMIFAGASHMVALGAAKQHGLRQEAQSGLREVMLRWGGLQRLNGRPDSESYKRFYFKFGVDVWTAKTLGRRKAEELTLRIQEEY